jgi:hypothetical protein
MDWREPWLKGLLEDYRHFVERRYAAPMIRIAMQVGA